MGTVSVADLFDIEVEELAEWLRAPEQTLVLLDVREVWEVNLCALDGSLFIPVSQIRARVREIPTDRRTVVLCHHGIRSRHIVRWLQQLGYNNVTNLSGGIDAWARRIDPKIATY